jgi:hypothetical protein
MTFSHWQSKHTNPTSCHFHTHSTSGRQLCWSPVHTYVQCPRTDGIKYFVSKPTMRVQSKKPFRGTKLHVKKDTAKICETFSHAALFQLWILARKLTTSPLKYTEWFTIQEFRQDNEERLWNFGPEIWLQNPKQKYKTSQSNSCLKQISRNAKVFSQWFLIYK